VGGVSRGRPVARRCFGTATGAEGSAGRNCRSSFGTAVLPPNEVLPRKVSPSMATAPSPGFQILGTPSSMDRHNPPLSP
jgi:hypothetical protein